MKLKFHFPVISTVALKKIWSHQAQAAPKLPRAEIFWFGKKGKGQNWLIGWLPIDQNSVRCIHTEQRAEEEKHKYPAFLSHTNNSKRSCLFSQWILEPWSHSANLHGLWFNFGFEDITLNVMAKRATKRSAKARLTY